MKIVFLADCITTQKAGIHYYARNLVDQIIKSYPEHDYYLVASEKIEDLQISQIIVPINEFIPFHLRWRQVFIIPKEVGKVNPDYVIELAHFGPFNLRSAIDRVTVIHDLTPITHPRWHPFISSITHKLILPYVVKRAKYIITNSSWTKAQIKRYYQKNDQDVLVSYPRLKDLSDHKKFRQSKDPLKRYFLTVGTIEPRKNHVTIIRAFDLFCKAHKDFQWIIVGGDGWKNGAFWQVLKESPNQDKIKITGFLSREQVLQLYQGATAFIFASLYEGFGMPMIEASYFSLPLLLADNESLPHFYRERALLFDPLDAGKLADNLEKVVSHDDLRQELEQKSREAFIHFEALKTDLDIIFKP